MDIQRLDVYVPMRNTQLVKRVPPYEIPCLRELIKIKNNIALDQLKIVGKSPDGAVVRDANMRNELRRLQQSYKKLFRLAYATDADFEEAFAEAAKSYRVGDAEEIGTLAEEREPLPIESINGIGESLADAIAAQLGSGSFKDLAEADPFLLQGIDGISMKGAKKFIAEARKLAGFVDTYSIDDAVNESVDETPEIVE